MSKSVIMHPQTETQLKQFMVQPSHALLLVGSDGIGKTRLAKYLAENLLGLDQSSLKSYPYLLIVSPNPASISIEAVRELQHFLQLKTTGNNTIRRVIIMEHSDCLTLQAQSALLKTLEEPPLDTVMIYTINAIRSLLPTLLSRLQIIDVYPPSIPLLNKYFANQGKSQEEIVRTYYLSGGLPGLMDALLKGNESHPLVTGVAQAKILLTQSLFERLSQVDSLSKQKDALKYIVEALIHIAETGIEKAGQSDNPKRIKQWLNILSEAEAARLSLSTNANTKLTLTNLMMRL